MVSLEITLTLILLYIFLNKFLPVNYFLIVFSFIFLVKLCSKNSAASIDAALFFVTIFLENPLPQIIKG